MCACRNEWTHQILDGPDLPTISRRSPDALALRYHHAASYCQLRARRRLMTDWPGRMRLDDRLLQKAPLDD
jgi:hypothetical protein